MYNDLLLYRKLRLNGGHLLKRIKTNITDKTVTYTRVKWVMGMVGSGGKENCLIYPSNFCISIFLEITIEGK